MVKSPRPLLKAPAAQFLERTQTGDWGWAEQMLGLGFDAYAEIVPGTPWAVVAAQHDRTDGRIAHRLVQDLLQRMTTEPARTDDHGRTLATCLTVAIEAGNACFLGAMAPLYDAQPAWSQDVIRKRLLLGVRPIASYQDLLWTLVMNAAVQSSQTDRESDAWTWVRTIPGYDPSIWTDPSPAGLRATLAQRLTSATFEPSSIVRTHRFMEQLEIEPFLNHNPDMIDTTMAPWRARAPLDRWVLHNEQRFTRIQELKGLIIVLDWAGRRGAPTVTTDGRDLLDEARVWADDLAKRNDELLHHAAPLRSALTRWETATLRRTAEQAQPGDAHELPPRPRL